ncbi:hypothetical protein [Mesorhizobium sp. 1M-11]|uniref:hypothetical protein n=1 Tax=Mesorhizobium sp. 1M-11 TaxID=1529006 RepID=UPI00128EBA1C|nr:hypothetical protein [Mesorhizobium sp. 1M-11]
MNRHGFKPGASKLGPKGGRGHTPAPYTRDLRCTVFGPDEKRRLIDIRQSGAVEANASGGSVEAIAAKMGNSIDQNNLPAVRAADEARRKGRKLLGKEQNGYKKLKLAGKES